VNGQPVMQKRQEVLNRLAITGVFQILALQLLGVVAGGRELAQ